MAFPQIKQGKFSKSKLICHFIIDFLLIENESTMIKLGNSVERQNEFLGPEYVLILQFFIYIFHFSSQKVTQHGIDLNCNLYICLFVFG